MHENIVFHERIYWHFLCVSERNCRVDQWKENRFLANVEMRAGEWYNLLNEFRIENEFVRFHLVSL